MCDDVIVGLNVLTAHARLLERSPAAATLTETLLVLSHLLNRFLDRVK